MTKETITKMVRPLLVKYITRGALWLLTAKLGYEATAAETEAGQIGSAVGALACVLLGLAIDRWHHKKDKAEVPEV